MFCSNCGSRLADGAKFCSECGARVAVAAEPDVRTFADIDFEEPKVETEAPAAAPAVDEVREKPAREKVSFDWSNVVDEPHRKEIKEIKSPWGTTGGIDEKELYAEMTPSTDKSRTMSFIDVLKAEKEEKERAAADRAIEYTEVLEFDPDLTAFEEPPNVHFAPLYEDVDAPVKTPFDEPESKPEPVFTDEPRFEAPEVPEVVAEPEAPAAPAEPEFPAEPEEPSLELSRETIAQFDEYVKSFEKEAGISEEPEAKAPVEEPSYEAPFASAPKFELPDFLKKMTDMAKPAPKVEAEPEPAPEPVYEEPEFIPGEPAVIELDDFDDFEEEPDAGEPVFEEPVFDEPTFEEPVFEEPKYDEGGLDEGRDDSMEDLYLDLDPNVPTGDYKPSFEVNDFDDDDEEDEEEVEEAEEEAEAVAEVEAEPEPEEEEEEDVPVDEEELFKEMEESAPDAPSMTIAPPADKESEIEALRRRLAELTGTMEPVEPETEVPEEEPAEDLFTEPAEVPEEEPEAEAVEEPEEEAAEEPAAEAEPVGFEAEVTPDIDALFASLIPASKAEAPAAEEDTSIEDLYLQDFTTESVLDEIEEEAPAVEEVVEEVVEEAPAVEEVVEEIVEEAPAVEEVVEEVVEEAPAVEEVVEEIVEEAPAAEEVVEEVVEEAPAVEEVVEEIVEEAPVVEEIVEEAPVVEEVVEEAAPAAEEVVEEIVEEAPAVEEVVEEIVEEAPAVEEAKETDALSLEELEKDLFGESLPEEAEAEETKKIDKFYTLYRKNEEFQRLLDEEYERLKHGGNLTEEEKQAVDAVPKMADVEAAKAAAVAAPVAATAAAVAAAVKEPEPVPVEENKAYRQVEDETIYMPKELVEEQVKADFAAASGKAPAEVPADPADNKKKSRKEKKEEKKAKKLEKQQEKNAGKDAGKQKVEVEYEDVESGSKFLTILAVIIAVILVLLLAVILILTIAPGSDPALFIDDLIDNLVSRFGAVVPMDGQFLL